MATVTIGPDAASILGAYALWDALYTLKVADTYEVNSSTSATVQIELGLQVDFVGTDLDQGSGGTITSFTVSYEGTEEFTASGSGLSLNGQNVEDALGNADLLKLLFDGISWNVDFSSSGTVHFNGTGGNDTVILSSEADVYGLDGGNDLVNLGDGDDTIVYYSVLGYSASGTVKLDAGIGFDTLDLSGNGGGFYNGEAATPLSGGMKINLNKNTLDFGDFVLKYSNLESIVGTTFGDTIIGTKGADVLVGGGAETGFDTYIGGGGLDDLWGTGGSADRFVYTKATDSKVGKNHDYILSFDHGIDKIDLSKLHPDSAKDQFVFVGDKKLAEAGDLHVIFYEGHAIFPAYAMVEANIDGKGGPDLQIQIVTDVELTKSDFIL